MPNNEIIRELEIDVARENTFAAILAKQYDRATRYILATITNLGVPIAVDASTRVTINFERPHTDNENVSDYQAAFSGAVVDGKVKVPLTYWALERDGDVKADISMSIGDNRLSSLDFTIRVQSAAYDGNAVITDDHYDVLTGLILEVQALNSTVTQAESARATAESGRVSAESGRVSAESGRVSAENTRVSNENARKSAETSRASAETARVTAENARASAETTRASNETSRQSAESARASAEGTRQSNETARQTAESNRATAESGRVTAENNRVAAEQARDAAFQAALPNINAAAENAAIVQEIAASMQMTFFYDDEGYPCYEDKN